jgi:hypothetical protein
MAQAVDVAAFAAAQRGKAAGKVIKSDKNFK